MLLIRILIKNENLYFITLLVTFLHSYRKSFFQQNCLLVNYIVFQKKHNKSFQLRVIYQGFVITSHNMDQVLQAKNVLTRSNKKLPKQCLDIICLLCKRTLWLRAKARERSFALGKHVGSIDGRYLSTLYFVLKYFCT